MFTRTLILCGEVEEEEAEKEIDIGLAKEVRDWNLIIPEERGSKCSHRKLASVSDMFENSENL